MKEYNAWTITKNSAEISVEDIKTIDIWIEFENFGETVTVIADPIQERFIVKES